MICGGVLYHETYIPGASATCQTCKDVRVEYAGKRMPHQMANSSDRVPCKTHNPRIDRVSSIKLELCFPGFWPNPGPGRRPLDSGRRDVEFASVFASVASSTVSVMRKSICWNPVQRKIKLARAMAGFGPRVVSGFDLVYAILCEI